MPVYEYKCEDCGRRFDLLASLAEKETGLEPECPKCGSSNCLQVFGHVNIVTTSKSDAGFEDDMGGDEDLGGMPDDDLDGSGFGGDTELDGLD
jgi:putative FmdB family regulatory protein